jgi:hypothetical protein
MRNSQPFSIQGVQAIMRSFAAGTNGAGAAARRRARSRRRLVCEALERREVLATVPVTDMTQLAQLFPRHAGPTNLYLNFDGDTAAGVSAFQAVTANRDRDIAQVLYESSELFAPFDVQVRRVTGDGARSTGTAGDSTIFIGDILSGASAWVPWASADYPGPTLGRTHQPNSNPNDVGYVDPIGLGGGSWSITRIVQAVGHEAGHTFGLAHVRTDGEADPTSLGTGRFNEMMSYDSINTHFSNRSHAITSYNFNPSTSSVYLEPNMQPTFRHYDPVLRAWRQDNVRTQNSYTYLQAAIGARPADDFANVVHTGFVDPTYVDGASTTLSLGGSLQGTINRIGDYDALRLTIPYTAKGGSQTLSVDLSASVVAGTAGWDPTLMVYNASGTLVHFNDNMSGSNWNSRLVVSLTSGTYRLVVGGSGGAWSGNYQLKTGLYVPPIGLFPLSLAGSTINTAAAAPVAKQGPGVDGAMSNVGASNHSAVGLAPRGPAHLSLAGTSTALHRRRVASSIAGFASVRVGLG